MTVLQFTYGGDPSVSTRDAVRFHLGDTDRKRPLLDDREVEFALTKHGNEFVAAALCAESLQGKFSSRANVTVGGVSKAFGSIAQAFADKAKQLRREASKSAVPRAPALSISEKRAADLQTDDVQPEFRIGLGDNRFAVQINDAIGRVRDFDGLV